MHAYLHRLAGWHGDLHQPQIHLELAQVKRPAKLPNCDRERVVTIVLATRQIYGPITIGQSLSRLRHNQETSYPGVIYSEVAQYLGSSGGRVDALSVSDSGEARIELHSGLLLETSQLSSDGMM